jgi:hypothetical protein
MKSDTPETDKLLADATGYPHPMDAVDLARKLERERDEARKQADEWREYAVSCYDGYSYAPFKWEDQT